MVCGIRRHVFDVVAGLIIGSLPSLGLTRSYHDLVGHPSGLPYLSFATLTHPSFVVESSPKETNGARIW